MKINVESYELSLWSRQDEFLSLLKAPFDEFEGQAYNIKLTKNLNGFKSLDFSIPMYIFNNDTQKIGKNIRWQSILNEQKIRLKINPNSVNEEIYEFILQTFTETRTGLEKVANCICQDLAIYELSKIGWGITYSEDTITEKEIIDFSENESSKIMTIDYWMAKVFYLSTKLGRVDSSNPSDLEKLANGITPRNEYGYSTAHEDPIALTPEIIARYENLYGWSWLVNSDDNKLYEENKPVDYWKVSEIEWAPVSWQYNDLLNEPKQLRYHPITTDDTALGWKYSLEEKKRIIAIERSNVYNIIEELASKFEFWPVFQYTYDANGTIIARTIIINNEVLEPNDEFEIRFGVNMSSISRTIESGDIVTKLFVPPINSSSIDGKTISISNANENFMREMYLLNFDYYFKSGSLTLNDRENISNFERNVRNLNIQIEVKQNEIYPILDQIDSYESEIEVNKASIAAYNKEILDLQNKKDTINIDDAVIESWNTNQEAEDFIGEYKTIANDTVTFNKNGVLGGETVNFNGIDILYEPRYFNRGTTWNHDDVTEDDFTIIPADNVNYKSETYLMDMVVGFSTFGLTDINGAPLGNSIRVRYKYIPYLWYDLLQEELINKRTVTQNQNVTLNIKLDTLYTLLESKELLLADLINEKNSVVQLFERDYKYFIKEGQWEDNDYSTYTKMMYSENWAITYNPEVYLSEYPLEDTTKFTHFLPIPVEADLSTLSVKTENDVEFTLINNINLFFGNGYDGECFLFGIVDESVDENTIVTIKYKSTFEQMVEYTDTFKTLDNNIRVFSKTAEIIDNDFIFGRLNIYNSTTGDQLVLYEDFDYETKTIEGIDNTYYNAIIVTFKYTNNTYPVNWRDMLYYEYEKDITSKFFYNDAFLTSQTAAIPNVTYTVEIVNIAGIPGYENFKPEIGMMVPIYDNEMLFNGFEGFITEITYDLENPEQTTITITSYKNKFADLFQRIAETTNTINFKEEDLYRAANAFGADGSLTEDAWYKSFLKNKVTMTIGPNNDVLIDQNGITLTDVTPDLWPQPLVRMGGKGIFLSTEMDNNGNRIWRTGITAQGINASEVNTGNLNVKNLMIWNEDQYRFLWDTEGIKAFGEYGDGTTNYTKYVKFNEQGITFNYEGTDGNESSVVRLDWTGLIITSQSGAVEINSKDGFLVKDNLGNTRAQLGKLSGPTDLYGLRLTSSTGGTVMQTDTSGQLWLSEFLNVGDTEDLTGLVGLYGGNNVDYMVQGSPIRLWAGSAISNEILPPFFVTHNGYLSATNANIEGSIVATSGSIGGWNISNNYISANNIGLISTQDAGALSIWSGSTVAENATAPFRVYNDGRVFITNGQFGGTVDWENTNHPAGTGGEPLYGVSITAEKGFEVVRTDGQAYTIMNADEFKMQSYDPLTQTMKDRIYFDIATGKYVFDGTLSVTTLQAITANIEILVTNSLVTQTFMAQKGYIAELTVDQLDTSNKLYNYQHDITDDIPYIRIRDQDFEFITAVKTADDPEQAVNRDGAEIYWVDETETVTTLTVTDYPAMTYLYDERTKLKLSFNGEDPNVPVIEMGYGDGILPKSAKGYVKKSPTGMRFEYYKSNTEELVFLELGDNGITSSGGSLGGGGFIVLTEPPADLSIYPIGTILLIPGNSGGGPM